MLRDPKLADELAALTPDERRLVEAELGLRERAERIAKDLGLDAHDVYHVLQCLSRTPTERLRRGLAHGRVGRRVAL